MFDVKTSEKNNNRLPDIGEVYEMYSKSSGYGFCWMCTNISIIDGKLVFSGYSNRVLIKEFKNYRFYPFGPTAGINILYDIRNYEVFAEDEFRIIYLRYLNKITAEKMLEWFNHINTIRYIRKVNRDKAKFEESKTHTLPFFREGGVYISPAHEFIICINAMNLSSKNLIILQGFRMSKEGYSITETFKIDMTDNSINNWLLKGQLSSEDCLLYKALYQNFACPNISFILNDISDESVIDYRHYKQKTDEESP